jgi:aconitate decarboxylase
MASVLPAALAAAEQRGPITGREPIVRLVGRPAQRNPDASYARLCLGYVVAKMLQHGALDLAHFRSDDLADPATYALAERVSVQANDNPDPSALAPQSVVVRLRDGTELSWHCETMLASSARKLNRHQQLAKFSRCVEFASEPLPAGMADQLVSAD